MHRNCLSKNSKHKISFTILKFSIVNFSFLSKNVFTKLSLYPSYLIHIILGLRCRNVTLIQSKSNLSDPVSPTIARHFCRRWHDKSSASCFVAPGLLCEGRLVQFWLQGMILVDFRLMFHHFSLEQSMLVV